MSEPKQDNEAAGGRSDSTAVLERWSKWIINNPPYIGGDHACAECYPNSEIIKPGFVCVYHEAEHWRERSNASGKPPAANELNKGNEC